MNKQISKETMTRQMRITTGFINPQKNAKIILCGQEKNYREICAAMDFQ